MTIILSTSLNPESRSRLLAEEAHRVLATDGEPAEVIDLREFPLPFCDGSSAYADGNVLRLARTLAGADALVLATPIYNYDVNAALKNVIELTGSAWEEKPVGFLCAAAGASSYMSVLSLANSLMLDFRCLIVPRFVYALGTAFSDQRIIDPEIERRVATLARTTARLGRAEANHRRNGPQTPIAAA